MADTTKTREELIASFSNELFSAMLHEVLMDAVLQSHKDVMRSKTLCSVCGTHCGSNHGQGGPSNGAGSSTGAVPSSAGSPTPEVILNTGTPVPKDKNDGITYFECTNCQKKIASNRYAPHLSACLGIGTGSRRGAARNASAKNKLGPDLDRGGTPAVSDYGSPAQDTPNGKAKSKAKSHKKANGKLPDLEFNGNHKRPTSSVDSSPNKKSKKMKTGFAPPSDVISTSLLVGEKPPKSNANSSSPPAPPSPSAASASQYSGRDSPSVSSINALSPSATNRPQKTYRPSGASQPVKRHGPPTGAPRTHIPKVEEREEDVDFIDVDGEEQDSSSSDSSSD